MKKLVFLVSVALLLATSCGQKKMPQNNTDNKTKDVVLETASDKQNETGNVALEFKHKSSGITAYVKEGKVFLRVNSDNNELKPVEGLKGKCKGVYIGDEGNDSDALICMLLEDGNLQILRAYEIMYDHKFTASDVIPQLKNIVAFISSDGTEDLSEEDLKAQEEGYIVGYGAWLTFAIDKDGKRYQLYDYLNSFTKSANDLIAKIGKTEKEKRIVINEGVLETEDGLISGSRGYRVIEFKDGKGIKVSEYYLFSDEDSYMGFLQSYGSSAQKEDNGWWFSVEGDGSDWDSWQECYDSFKEDDEYRTIVE